METMNWALDYSVGVVEIDGQHRELLNLLNSLIQHSEDSRAERKSYFQKVIIIVNTHVAKHFDTEERVLCRTAYEKLEEHKKEHEKISGRIKKIWQELGSSNGDRALYDLTVTLKEYFLSHILLYDKEAMDFFKAGSKLAVSDGFHAGII